MEQKNFEKIPGCPIGYWVSENIINSFQYNSIEKEAKVVIGIKTGDNEIFIRNWYEVDNQSTDFICKNLKDFNNSKKKWFPYVKGGEYRLWYGNQVQVLYWTNNGENMLNHTNKQGVKDARVRQSNFSLYGKEFLTWSRISSRKLGIRYVPQGVMFDCNSPSIFQYRTGVKYILGFLSTYVSHSILEFIAPTLSFQIQDIKTIPLIVQNENYITDIVNENISISRSDWDAHETSWDFQRNELLSIDTSTYMENIDYKIEKHFEETGEHISISPAAPQLGSLEWRMEQYKTKWERKFMQLHKNEEELNRQFIDIYGLQDELTPDVPLNEITILQQGEIAVAENGITWNEDVMTKQLISYAVGCMLGRYRLDKPGLHIAHPNPTDEEIAPYEYKGEQWEIDDDGIMPLMPNDCGFSDNASSRFADFIRVALGNEEHVANLNYVEKCLGKTVEQYFVKDFWKDHKKMYQNRPIYWLFSSKKGAFQVIAYMHRMNAYTAERVRSKYLLPYIEHLEAEIDKLDARRAELSTKETKQLQALQKQLDECREYHERLQVVAEQAISFDLDDGVVVNYAKFGDILQKIK